MAKRRVDEVERQLNRSMGWPENWDRSDCNDLRPDEEQAVQEMLAQPYHLQAICERVVGHIEECFAHTPGAHSVALTRGPDGFVAAAHALIRATQEGQPAVNDPRGGTNVTSNNADRRDHRQ